MKFHLISETIDGSIKDIVQLKTLDNSLEYSQMFDALEDCPKDFQAKLIQALNSVGETLQASPVDVFNIVLCASYDEDDKDSTKKMYNWWKAVFEILSKCEIPDDRKAEYDDLVDTLLAEVSKAGDDAQVNEAEEYGYEQANIEDEEVMLKDMEFAISKIGEIANKVQDLINFVNPYCQSVNEDNMMKFKKSNEGNRFGFRTSALKNHKTHDIKKMYISHKMSDEEAVDALLDIGIDREMAFDLVERWTSDYVRESGNDLSDEVVEVTYYLPEEYKDDPDDESWIKTKDKLRFICGSEYDGKYKMEKKDGESVYRTSGPEGYTYFRFDNPDDDAKFLEYSDMLRGNQLDDNYKVDESRDGEWVDMDDLIGVPQTDPADDNRGMRMESDVKEVEGFKVGDKVIWDDPDGEPTDGWTIVDFEFEYPDDDEFDSSIADEVIVDIEKEDGSYAQALLTELEHDETQVDEAKVVQDVTDVWALLKVLDDDEASKNLKDLIDSHVRSEEEIMDVIEELYPEDVTQTELNNVFASGIEDIVNALGLDVNAYVKDGSFVDLSKPSTIAAEMTDNVVYTVTDIEWDTDYPEDADGLPTRVTVGVPNDIVAGGREDVLNYISDYLSDEYGYCHDGFCVNDGEVVKEGTDDAEYLEFVGLLKDLSSASLTGFNDGDDESKIEVIKKAIEDKDSTALNRLLVLANDNGVDETNPIYAKIDGALSSFGEDEESKPEEVNGGEKKFKGDDGEVKTLDNAGKKVVAEMTIEQDVNSAEQLERLLWGQGKENFIELVSKYGADEVMSVLEDSGITNLTQMNDYLWFEIDQIEEMLGGGSDDDEEL